MQARSTRIWLIFLLLFLLSAVLFVGVLATPLITAEKTDNHFTYLPAAAYKALLPVDEDAILINFQPLYATVPDGYITDFGLKYSLQGDYSYGWSIYHTDVIHERNQHPDSRLDTLVHVKQDSHWEFAIDNGQYNVTISIGDPLYSSIYTVNIEGITYWDNLRLPANDFRLHTQTIMVNDGRLTLNIGDRLENEVRLNYLVIAPAQTGSTPVPPFTPSPTPSPTPTSTPVSTPTPTLSPTPTNTPTPSPTPPIITGDVFYVSRNGSNSNGRSWATAWSELDQINWDEIAAGDTILIDGGEDEMVYETSLIIDQSGTANNPIQIMLASEPGRDGQVRIFGGRSQTLPGFCGTPTYTNEEDLLRAAIDSNDHDWIIINGGKWSGIVIHGFEKAGVILERGSNNISLINMEIYNNGTIFWSNRYNKWRSDNPGILLGGSDMLFERLLIHDNGQDAIQSLFGNDNNLQNFHLRDSWLYNSIHLPINLDNLNEDCIHTDGLQIYSGGVVDNITIENSIIGPGIMNSLILGQTDTGDGTNATVNHVTIRHVTFIKPTHNGIYGYVDRDNRHWTVDHVTAYCPETRGNCLHIEGGNHTVTHSIIYGSNIDLPNDTAVNHNCQWATTGDTIGPELQPQFTSVSSDWLATDDDFALLPQSPCQGSGSLLNSAAQLLNR